MYWREEDRYDFKLARNAILRNVPCGNVLDVGCFRGDFLSMIPEGYTKFGIEPSRSAREIAERRGITIIGDSIDRIEIDNPIFTIVTLLDLIEHLPFPFESLQKAIRLLAPRGLLILSTGNTDALPWRMMRLDYWYYFSEHVSFFNRKWFNWVAGKLNLEIDGMEKFSHFKSTTKQRFRQLLKCMAFYLLSRRFSPCHFPKQLSILNSIAGIRQLASPPQTNLWKDHLFVVFRLKT